MSMASLWRPSRKRIGARLVVFFSALAGLSACHGTSQEEACAAYAQAVCNLINRCSPVTITQTFGDNDTCLARTTLSCSYQFPRDSNTPPDTFITCANALGNASCDDGTNIPECRPAPGNQPNGSACFADTQCQSTFCSRSVTTSGPCGLCASRAELSEDCDATACEPDLVCATQMMIGPARCLQPVSVGPGGACGQERRCQTGQLCVGGMCTTLLKQGDMCNPAASACDSNSGLYCDGTAMRCMAYLFVKAGQPCGAAATTPTLCSGSAHCLDQKLNSVCVGPATEGQRCSANYACMPPATCIDGLCALPDPPFCYN